MKFGKIKCLLFDLDGVLINGQTLQVNSTLESLKKFTHITREIKDLVKETITTKEKLEILYLKNLIKKKHINKIYINKKKIFERKAFKKIKFNKRIYNVFEEIKKRKLKVGVVTNSNKESAVKILKKLKIFKYLEIIVTNNNRIKPKPNPEPYNYAMKILKVQKKNTLIFEDSPVGLLSAKRSGANYVKIISPKQISCNFLIRNLK
jgi:HAD superfamily hydrolase (TIGR01509 family)